MLSDSDLLCAAQEAGASDETRNEFAARFVPFLRYAAGRSCLQCKLGLQFVNEVVDRAVEAMLDGDHAAFDPTRGETHLAYVTGMVRNAAKTHANFLRKGAKRRHDWAHPLNRKRRLPLSLAEICDHRERSVPNEVTELAERVLVLAVPAERVLIDRHFFGHESIDSIARSLGVARTTVDRRLRRFFARAAALLAA